MTQESEREKQLRKQLNQRQVDFVLNYIKTGKKQQSAKDAGYSEKTAHVIAARLLQNVKVVEYLTAVQDRLSNDKIADIEEVMQYLTRVMRGEELDNFGLDVSIQERTRAAGELARRLDIHTKNKAANSHVIINDDIPADDEDTEEG